MRPIASSCPSWACCSSATEVQCHGAEPGVQCSLPATRRGCGFRRARPLRLGACGRLQARDCAHCKFERTKRRACPSLKVVSVREGVRSSHCYQGPRAEREVSGLDHVPERTHVSIA